VSKITQKTAVKPQPKVHKLRPARPPARFAGAPANELGLRTVAFEVRDLQAAVDRAATDGYRLVGGTGA
jgi:hypothetical protein